MRVSNATAATLACLAILGLQAPANAENISVFLDQAKIMRLPERVATLVIGNPAIADGTLQAGGLLIVTGKSYGRTNVIALDPKGEILAEHEVTVGAPKDAALTVWRGAGRETWSCTPACENSVMLGDSAEYFDSVVKQVESRNNHAASRGK